MRLSRKEGDFDIDVNPIVSLRYSDESKESIREAISNESKVSILSDNDARSTEDDSSVVSILEAIMSSETTGELILRCRVPPGYAYRVLNANKYIFTLGFLHIGACKESF